MHKLVLKRRELILLLEHNGFQSQGKAGTSHVKYEGVVDGQRCCVTVDASKDEFNADSHGILYYIVSSQLRFIGDGKPAKQGWMRFYGGEPEIARRAQVPYRRWA